MNECINTEVEVLREEIARQEKVIAALMNRVERNSAAVASSEFDAFHKAVTLEEQVQRRTAELEQVLRDNQRITRDLRDSEEKFRRVVDQPLVGIVIIENGKIVYSNAKFAEIFGYSVSELSDLGLAEMAILSDRVKVCEQITRQLNGEAHLVDYMFRGRKKDGTLVDIEMHSSTAKLGTKYLVFSIALDVTKRVRAERETNALYDLLREQSIRDGLTGLYNRHYLDAALGQEINRSEIVHNNLTVTLCDIDHFKVVNDRYGHPCGDEVLRTFSGQLRKHYRATDLICRYGGEEFLIIQPAMPRWKSRLKAEEFRTALADMQVRFDDKTLQVTASFGIASYPDDATNASDLIACADKALYTAKRTGRNKIVDYTDIYPCATAESRLPRAGHPQKPSP